MLHSKAADENNPHTHYIDESMISKEAKRCATVTFGFITGSTTPQHVKTGFTVQYWWKNSTYNHSVSV